MYIRYTLKCVDILSKARKTYKYALISVSVCIPFYLLQPCIRKLPRLYSDNANTQETCSDHIDGSVQDCSNSIANALELLQSWTKPSISYFSFRAHTNPLYFGNNIQNVFVCTRVCMATFLIYSEYTFKEILLYIIILFEIQMTYINLIENLKVQQQIYGIPCHQSSLIHSQLI